jgi:hypothetical protein
MTLFGITIDPNNIDASLVSAIDTGVQKFIASKLPASANLTTLPALESAVIATANELLERYALAKLQAVISAKYPSLAGDLTALKNKLAAL